VRGGLVELRKLFEILLIRLSIIVFGCWIFSVLTQLQAGAAINLSQYRIQVENNYSGFSSSQLSQQASTDLEKNLPSLADTQLTANIYSNDDRRPTGNPSFQGFRTNSVGASIGIQKQFLSGPRLELAQHVSHSSIAGASSVSLPLADYYDTYPKLSLNIPLWRNLSGSEIKIKEESLREEARADSLRTHLQSAQLDVRVNMAFYSLAAARENIQVQKEILDRATVILEWITTKFSRNLVDSSDLYQSEAAVTARKMQLEEATTWLGEAQREFNVLRGVNSNVEVSEELQVEVLPIEELVNLGDQVKRRKDLALSQVGTRVQELNQRGRAQMSKPTLDLSAEGQWSGRDARIDEAQREILDKNQTLLFVGLKFSMPLDTSKSTTIGDSFQKMSEGSRLSVQSQESDQKRIWSDFVSLGKSLHQQIKLVQELEIIQRKKADEERKRLNAGRSTTFQTLSFEQDYSAAKSQRINIELKARQYIAQKSLFEEVR
jgi:outer membrane protein TolC